MHASTRGSAAGAAKRGHAGPAGSSARRVAAWYSQLGPSAGLCTEATRRWAARSVTQLGSASSLRTVATPLTTCGSQTGERITAGSAAAHHHRQLQLCCQTLQLAQQSCHASVPPEARLGAHERRHHLRDRVQHNQAQRLEEGILCQPLGAC